MIDIRSAWRLIWLLCALPLAVLAGRLLTHDLGPNPQEAILRFTGVWSLTLLLVTLGVTPLRQALRWPELGQLRRMLGLWTFVYACIHLLSFWAFEHEFDVVAVLKDGLKRPFVTLGLLSFAMLIPLALTSHRAAVRWLGPNWKRLHRLIYVIAVLSCIHFFLHRAGKNNFIDPAWAAAVTTLLLGLRAYLRR